MTTNTLIQGDNTPFVEANVVEYSSISPWAVLAFVLALISPVMFFSPLLIVLPLASCFVAVVALLKIRSSAGTKSGRALARWAMALATICMVAAPVRIAVRDHLLLKGADEAARHWLALLAEDRMDAAAHCLGPRALQKLSGPVNPGETPQVLTPQQVIVMMRNQDLVTALTRLGKETNLKMNQIDKAVNSTVHNWEAHIIYEVSGKSSDAHSVTPTPVKIEMRRWKLSEGGSTPWLISSWKAELAQVSEETP